jgi:hypothetical protein
MAKGMTVDIVQWLNTDVPKAAQDALVLGVGRQQQRVRSEQAQRSGGIEPSLETMIVDGRRNANTGDIKATSRVILDWNYITEAAIKTIGYLRLHGPERSGNWKDSVIVMVDGHEQHVDEPFPSNTAQVTVVVAAPYARKLEVGRTESGRAFSIQVAQHFVEASTIRLRTQMRDLATFQFTYVDLAGAHVLTSKTGTHRRSFRSGRARLSAKRSDTTVRYPAIVIDEIKALG